jgi:hypothetical protein
MATLIQILQNTLAQKDPLLANETKRIVLKLRSGASKGSKWQ